MRLFLAINLEPPTRRLVYQEAAGLRAAAPTLAWVPEERLHLTLRFLGEQPEDARDRVALAMDKVAGRHSWFSTALREFGGFPNLRRPRVVWIGMEHDPRLEMLHHDVEVACEGLGYPLEGRPFRPHVTLARAKAPIGRETAGALQNAAAAATDAAFETTIRSIDLVHSRLLREGARHELLHSSVFREA